MSDPAAAEFAPDRCPLCHGPNGCAMEATAGGSRAAAAEAPCWCTQISFGAGLLARVPPGAQGRACICARCAHEAAPPTGATAVNRPD